MSLFPRAFASDPATSFTPLFRLLDDFDNYSRTNGANGQRSGQVTRTFSPKFDVKELPEAYELHGELPGIEQKDVEIEFTDPQTLSIRGRTERTYTSGTPPAGLVEGGKKPQHITERGHQPTVEDEDAAKRNESGSSTAVAASQQQQQQPQQQQPPQEQAKYWVSERSVGEFARSFSFPVRVDQDAVKASMKNGVLSIVVPKAKKHESRRITIE